MSDYSKCVPDRVTAAHEFLHSPELDLGVRALAQCFQHVGQHAVCDGMAMEIDFPHVGLELRVTRHQAQIIVNDPTPDLMEVVADSGRSFSALYA